MAEKQKNDLEILRHSCAHLLAAAVKELYPTVKLGIGPAIAEGFYYDFARTKPFAPEELAKIEERMRALSQKNESFEKEVLTKTKAKSLFKKLGETFKLELLAD